MRLEGKRIGRPRTNIVHFGDVFGMLTAKFELEPRNGRQTWLYQCECGTFLSRQVESVRFSVRSGSTANCGYLTRKLRSAAGKMQFEHGLSVANPWLYGVHAQMLRRCYNGYCKDYVHYGARGIEVCDDWHDPVKFFSWAAQSGYARGLTIERKDVNGDYNPENCTWITNERQSHNTTRNVFLTIGKNTFHLAEWARRFGVKWPTANARIRSGWDLQRAVSEPVKSKRTK